MRNEARVHGALTRTNHELQAVPSVSPRHHIETKFLEMEEETPALAQLLGMKTRALQRRAVELGVGEDALEDAEDKSELIVLIMAHMQSPSLGSTAPSDIVEGALRTLGATPSTMAERSVRLMFSRL